jgi:LuxR family maltose regulon positive regulatory protein
MATATLADSSKYTIPEPASSVLRRQRLLDFLHEHIDHPLQLICAPAGYGKTTLLGDFARDTDLTVCWYAVDELDGDARSFLRHVAEAIKARFPVLDDSVELAPLGLPDADFNWRGTVGQLTSGISRYIPEYFVLVIDDFHIASSNPAVADAVDFLVQHLPDNCRLIISSREMPQLASLPKLISLGRVVGLGTTDLRFTGGEIKALLKSRFGLEVTTEEALRLEQESEGWITSITLTAHPLRKGLFKEILANRGQNSLLFDYMAAEVFRQQPPRIQQVLLATSICNEFDDELGDALTGTNTSAKILEEVEYKNLLVTRLGGPHRWYRYHHLFREFLRDKLRREDPDRFRSLHSKAAEHYLAKGEPRQAIHYFLQGSELDRAAELFEEQVETIAHEGLWETLEGWLQQIPAERLATRPKLLLYLSRVHQLRGRNDEAIQVLNRTMAACGDQGQRGLEAQALMCRSISLRFKGAHQLAVRDARRALSLARTHGTAVDQADAHSHLGAAYFQQGKFLQSEREFRATLAGYQQLGSLFHLSDIHKRLGTVYSNLGQPAKAVTHFELARQGWEKLGNQQQLAVTLNNMANLYLRQGQYDLAEPLAREAIALHEALGVIRGEAYA